jgi:hypothetical protein
MTMCNLEPASPCFTGMLATTRTQFPTISESKKILARFDAAFARKRGLGGLCRSQGQARRDAYSELGLLCVLMQESVLVE